jgi:hypothetical protein
MEKNYEYRGRLDLLLYERVLKYDCKFKPVLIAVRLIHCK